MQCDYTHLLIYVVLKCRVISAGFMLVAEEITQESEEEMKMMCVTKLVGFACKCSVYGDEGEEHKKILRITEFVCS